MSCMWCIHFVRDFETTKDLKGEAYLRAPGACTLEPEWREVSGAHFCGSFRWKTSGDTTTLANWWIDDQKNGEIEKELRGKVKRLNEANRKLRLKRKT